MRQFRGSIAEPQHALFTLRRTHYYARRKTRFRVLAKLSRTGLVTRKVSTKGFRVNFPLSQAFLTQWPPGPLTFATQEVPKR
jgi:hypothetical protein